MKLNQMKKNMFGQRRGFSLLEVIIALFVLSIGVLGMLTLISNSIMNSNEARDMIMASQLAQEGTELVRNKRDGNVLVDPTNVFNGLDAEDSCRVDAVSGLICPSATFNLDYTNDVVAFRFEHSAGTATKFSRKIVIEEPSVAERKVRSFVYWGSTVPLSDGSNCLNINKCVYAETTLTDWGEK